MATRGRVIVLEGDHGVLAVREVEFPSPGAGQVLLQIDACGVEPRQLHQLAAHHEGLLLLGCEASGRVLEVGEGASWLAPDGSVIVSPYLRQDVGAFLPVIIEMDDGPAIAPDGLFTFATNALVDARYVYPIARQRDHEASAILGSTVASALAAANAAAITAGSTVAVFGLGGGGQALTAVARALGASVVIAVDPNDARLALAKQCGATETVGARGAASLTAVRELSPGGLDVVFDNLFEHTAKVRPGTRLLAPDGHALLFGQPGSEEEAARLGVVARENGYRIVPAPTASDALIARALDLVASAAISPSALVSNRYTIEGVNEAMRDLEDGRLAGAGIIVMEPLR